MILKQSKKMKAPLRVFIAFFHPKTSVTAMGGAEKRLVETLKFFCRERDLQITVLEATPSLLQNPQITCRKEFVTVNLHAKGWLGTYLEWAVWIWKAFFKSLFLFCRVKPQVVLVPNNTLPNLFLGCFVAWIFKTPLCIVVHHVDTPFSRHASKNYSLYTCYRSIRYSRFVSLAKTVATYMSFSLLKRAQGIIAVSNFTVKTLRNIGVSKARIVLSGNALDLNFIEAVEPFSAGKVFDGIFVGRIAKEKGVFDLLKMWKNVVKVRKEAKLLLVGSGLELSIVKKKVSVLGLENKVCLHGRCSDKELYSLLKSSKIFIFPSLFEGWGIAVAEALACGLPVVAYDIPALREVFGNCKSVFLVPVRNVENMTATVLDILNVNDKEWRELSFFSKSYSRQFCWEEVAKEDLKLLRIFKKDA
ncbi:MAG: glycosyltransferase [Candidatus Bathyarchaeota archaeon]|jgi:glycosyltransferase involved in cell wall biosynthesis|nr:glycosyltransferase [Candidatus Bathyarchaeota archaeon A05DMB-5]MDH7557722.1 glycosyltransferase [Candidatus Bathyarchaeota archaeon]